MFFFHYFCTKKKLLRYKMCGNIKHFTLLVVKHWHRGKDLGSRLTNPVNRKFQIVQKQEYFLHIIKCYLRAVRCPTLLWCDPNLFTRSGWKEKKSRKTSTVVIKTCQPYLFRMTWSTDRKEQISPATWRDPSRFSYRRKLPYSKG